ncbi:MAG: ABC transporter permease [Alphaproteobacteria bacterium PRO2]|nr:ABC transporter permease [Alphaproteobacteria bacterium PRO2]
MRLNLKNIFRLGVKELRSLYRDPIMLFMIFWAFSISIYIAGTSISHDLHNASIAIVDEDQSPLSMRIRNAFLPPYFNRPDIIAFQDIDEGMDMDKYTFVLVIPEKFEADVLRGYRPVIQINLDATAVMVAGIGAGYIQNIINNEVVRFASGGTAASQQSPVEMKLRYAFNPNLSSKWFVSLMEIISNVTMFTILLTGAALIREQEHGTIEHLLVMPVTPLEIMLSKVWASQLVILTATALSLWIMVQGILQVPVAGSVTLFLSGVLLYLFFASALGIFLGTIARSMPQFGLLFILTILPMQLLSGGQTPLESQPEWLQHVMWFVPSTHFVSFAQAILYRGAGLDIVWPNFLAVAVVGLSLLSLSSLAFRRSIAA